MKPAGASENQLTIRETSQTFKTTACIFCTRVSKSGILMPDQKMQRPLTKLIKFVVFDGDMYVNTNYLPINTASCTGIL
jgi:hypothetical protein